MPEIYDSVRATYDDTNEYYDSQSADADFVLSCFIMGSTAKYYDENYWVSFRVYQEGI